MVRFCARKPGSRPMSSVAGDGPPVTRRPRRVWVFVVAGLLFAGVFVLRLVVKDPDHVVTLLYGLPIALVAIELGMAWGLVAAALALGLFGVWDAVWAGDNGGAALEYSTRGSAFFVLGGFVGALADRLRRVSAESARFWELSNDLLCTAGFDGYFKRLNPAWERTLGWTLEELRSQPFIEFLHPDDREQTEAEAASLTTTGHQTFDFENRYRCKDGGYRTLQWGARSFPEEGLIHATARDITESKRAEEILREQERRTRQILDNAHDAFASIDTEGVITAWNASAETMFGWSREEAVGRVLADTIIPPEHREAHARGLERFLATGEGPVLNKRVELTALHRVRGQFPVELTIWPLTDANGYSFHAFLQDITERKRVEAVVAEAKQEAERANQAKSEFLSRMSHELRTPLNAVIGFGQLLELDDLDPRQREGVEQILKAGRHLLELINEVLDISRIESGTLSISLEPVHLGSVFAEALSLIRPLADEAEVRLSADPSERGDLHVLADQQRLKQVLINLLSNAVKYNRRGGEVRVRCTELAEGRVEIAVADTGRGMTAEQLERLFDPFDRLGAERDDVEGTGLGLSLSMGLTEAMGGTIKAESEPEAGTTMRVELDAAEGPEVETAAGNSAPAAADGPTRERRTIVYIEDNLSNLKLVEQLLDRLPGMRLIPAMQGKLGIDLARQHRPDLILLDLHLPDLHGREVLEQLKRDPATAAIPVVVISADATPAQVERLRASGATDYLTKPIDVQSLLNTVTGGLSASASR